MQWITSKWINEPIKVFYRLGIPDFLGNTSMTLEELSLLTQTIPEKLIRLLRVLESVKIVSVTDNDISLTETGSLFQKKQLGCIAGMIFSDWHDSA